LNGFGIQSKPFFEVKKRGVRLHFLATFSRSKFILFKNPNKKIGFIAAENKGLSTVFALSKIPSK
jgi:hypothetical protein